MQVKFKRKAFCREKSVKELEDLCSDCELNATGSTHGCAATIFTDDDEKFFRLFTRAYIYAKREQKGAYILHAVRDFGRREKISGDLYTQAFHFLFWRKEISPNEAKMMSHAIGEMRDLAEKKFETLPKKTSDKKLAEERKKWGKIAVALGKYFALLTASAELEKPLFIQ